VLVLLVGGNVLWHIQAVAGAFSTGVHFFEALTYVQSFYLFRINPAGMGQYNVLASA